MDTIDLIITEPILIECVKDFGVSLPEGYIFKDENGNVINATKIVLEKKKKEYPKTYEECLIELIGDNPRYDEKYQLLETFRELLICRDAYWKIAGEERRWD